MLKDIPAMSVNSVTSGASRVAIVHDWLTGMRGGEKVLEAICELYPDATLHTLVRVPGSVAPQIERRRVKASPVQWLPECRAPATATTFRCFRRRWSSSTSTVTIS